MGEELDEFGSPLSGYIAKTDKEPQAWLPEELNEFGIPLPSNFHTSYPFLNFYFIINLLINLLDIFNDYKDW